MLAVFFFYESLDVRCHSKLWGKWFQRKIKYVLEIISISSVNVPWWTTSSGRSDNYFLYGCWCWIHRAIRPRISLWHPVLEIPFSFERIFSPWIWFSEVIFFTLMRALFSHTVERYTIPWLFVIYELFNEFVNMKSALSHILCNNMYSYVYSRILTTLKCNRKICIDLFCWYLFYF